MSTLLAFDTSTEQLSIAVGVGDSVWRHEGAGGAKASATLIPAILALLGEAGVTLAELDAIAFGQGPGSFTGLRTACSVAQGLAYGAAKPVLPVGTLLTVAEVARDGAKAIRVWVLMDARMNEIYAAEYEYGPDAANGHAGGWRERHAPAVWSAGALNAAFREREPEVVAGSALDAFGAALETGAAVRQPAARPHAWAMLPLAEAIRQRGGAVQPADALPLYLRDKVAETIAERVLARAARATVSGLPT